MNAVEAETQGTVKLTRNLTVKCPYDDITDEYIVTVEYVPHRQAIEFQSWADALEEYRDEEISNERLCEMLFRRLRAVIDPHELTVTVAGEHYGIDVEVRRSL